MRNQPLADGVELEEIDAGGVGSVRLTPSGGFDSDILYLHGGGFRLGSARGWAAFNSHLAVRCKARVLSVDYRLAPEHPFPAALSDARAAYEWLLASGVDPGGWPSAVIPPVEGSLRAFWSTCVSATFPVLRARFCSRRGQTCGWSTPATKAARKPISSSRAKVRSKAPACTSAITRRRDPLASPVLASWSGQPPLLIQVSDAEVLADDAVELARPPELPKCR